jgi:2,3-bisphosphoglycerate-dependent phosphoglycerate mutase
VSVEIVFETHSLSEDNERGKATGWLDGRLSDRGRRLAKELGERRRADNPAAVFSSDLGRARETTAIAFGTAGLPILWDWRLRECDYGELNGAPVDVVHTQRTQRLDDSYPGGESWRQAVERVGRCLDDVPTRWDGRLVVIVGHVATKWALDHRIHGMPLEDLAASAFEWEEGWRYSLPAALEDASRASSAPLRSRRQSSV